MIFDKKKLIKSPLNYTGGKYKILPQILPLFPDNIDTFIDLFAGGCNVGINVKAKKVICNDVQTVVIDMMQGLKNTSTKKALSVLKEIINKYRLSKTNEEGFKKIREDYNKGDRSWYMFYAMMTHAFNYQIRFNKQGDYNVPFGRNRSSFNNNLEKNFVKFAEKIHENNIIFSNKDFRELKINKLNKNDFVYCDPHI